MKKIFSFLALLLIASTAVKAQSVHHSMNMAMHHAMSQRTLHVTASAKVLLPADLIQFNITISAEAKTAQKAYQKHQQLEQELVSLLEKYNIDEEDIQFQPMSISEYREGYGESYTTYYQTRQTVTITFSNFDIYENIQVALIGHGFDQFSGNFLTTQKKKGMDKALRKAIQNAKDIAQLMAEEAGVQLVKVKSMSYSENTVRPYASSRVALAAAETQGLLQYSQTVAVTARVSMEFVIK